MSTPARLLFLDTETTGLEPEEGHRIIELACLEMQGRTLTGKQCRWLIDPQREVPADSVRIHGINTADLKGQPLFSEIAEELLGFVAGGKLVMHNAPFDLGFINAELRTAGYKEAFESHCAGVIDTLPLARGMHPGQRNSLDALCQRYNVDASARAAGHGALLDAQLLAAVYLAMTSGQIGITLSGDDSTRDGKLRHPGSNRKLTAPHTPLPVPAPDAAEEQAHERILQGMEKQNGKPPVWG